MSNISIQHSLGYFWNCAVAKSEMPVSKESSMASGWLHLKRILGLSILVRSNSPGTEPGILREERHCGPVKVIPVSMLVFSRSGWAETASLSPETTLRTNWRLGSGSAVPSAFRMHEPSAAFHSEPSG